MTPELLTDLPADTVIEPDAPPQIEQAGSIADHAAAYGKDVKPATVDEGASPAEDLKPIRPVDQQRRQEGRFAEGHKPLKARDAVQRINQLTGRAKEAEEKLAAATAELERLRTSHASPATIARAEERVEKAETRVEQTASTFTEPEPKEDDPAFEGDYAKYLRAAARWEARHEHHNLRMQAQQEYQRQQQQAEQHKALEAFSGRAEAAKARIPDLQASLDWPAPWLKPDGSAQPFGIAIDAFITDDNAGLDVLHYLRTHPEETDALLRKPALAQISHLAILGQRLTASSEPSLDAAGTTGAARERVVVLPPKPPTPVRTEARSARDLPPTGESLSIAEHSKRFARTRR